MLAREGRRAHRGGGAILAGDVLVEGEVLENSVRYESGFDIGT